MSFLLNMYVYIVFVFGTIKGKTKIEIASEWFKDLWVRRCTKHQIFGFCSAFKPPSALFFLFYIKFENAFCVYGGNFEI